MTTIRLEIAFIISIPFAVILWVLLAAAWVVAWAGLAVSAFAEGEGREMTARELLVRCLR